MKRITVIILALCLLGVLAGKLWAQEKSLTGSNPGPVTQITELTEFGVLKGALDQLLVKVKNGALDAIDVKAVGQNIYGNRGTVIFQSEAYRLEIKDGNHGYNVVYFFGDDQIERLVKTGEGVFWGKCFELHGLGLKIAKAAEEARTKSKLTPEKLEFAAQGFR